MSEPSAARPAAAAPSPTALRATIVATAVSLLLVLAIVLGSRYLRTLDAALLPYAVATVFLAFGVAYRCTVRLAAPAPRNLHRQGRHSLFSAAGLRAVPAALARTLAVQLGFRTPPGAGSRIRWIAHQLIVWGCLLAVLITFPMTWGWVSFTATSPAGPGYMLRIWGFEVLGFDALNVVGWALFHVLDLAAVLVIAGAGYFLWQRMRNRGGATGQNFAYDMLPLLALIVIAVTGLLLTFSSLFLGGRGYAFLAVLHMVSVVFTLICLPFGKFFHIVQRPASAGVGLLGDRARRSGEILTCRRCEEPLGTEPAAANLRTTMGELDLRLEEWAGYCPRCKRKMRGGAYFAEAKKSTT
ncbi:MFS transporter [Streptomyces sp. NPDC048639]|uniref:MFS transporter n=1 Tax=Streptomyces sp. NPDC048639 TaxID=3365581 RepID=UPI00371ED50A